MATEVKSNKWGSDRFWNRLAATAGVFALLICVLLVANYIQVKKSDPVNMTVINSLVERLYANPEDSVLRKDIRTLDLLSRKAYFTSQWQIRTGGYLLLALIAVMVIAFQVIEYRKKINPVLSEEPEDEIMLQRRKARKWIVSGGSIFLLIAVIFAVLASNDLSARFAVLSKGENAVSEDLPVINSADTTTTAPQVSSDSTQLKDTAITTSVVASVDNFTNFRGNAGIALKRGIPVNWDGTTGSNVLWKTALPLPGQNSPVIWGDRIFVTGANSSKQEVYCFDRNTGKIMWTIQVGATTKKPRVSEETGLAAPTAVTDGTGVYVIFPTGDVAAIDMTGKKIWELDLGLPKNHYGHASSLMLYKENVLIQYDQTGSPKLLALSAKTGKTVWSADRPVKVSWSSPIVVNTGKRTEIITTAEPYVAAYNPANGKELWKIECISGEVGPSLAYANGIVFSVNDYSKLSAIRLGEQPTILWESNDYLSDIPSPAANDKYLFLSTSYGTVVCYDAVTGEKYWEKDLGKSVYSSPMIVENKVYILDVTGVMHIFSADKELKLIGEPKLGEYSACTPAFTNGRIYIKGETNLYCIGK
jgi:outer membrane protein assembly factor BamB